MDRMRLTGLMIKPSAVSGLFVLVLALMIMLGASYSFANKGELFFNFLLGENSSIQLIESTQGSVEIFKQTVLGNPLLNKILFFVFWMIIGLFVYLGLSGVGSVIGSAANLKVEISYVHAHKDKLLAEVRLRIVLRLIATGIWLMYAVLFFSIILPFSVLSSHIVTGNVYLISSWLYGILGFAVLVVGLHLHVVLARFLVLKPRLFGGWEDMLESELEHTIR